MKATLFTCLVFCLIFSCQKDRTPDAVITIDEKINLNPEVASVIEGKSVEFKAQFYNNKGVESSSDLPIAWESSDPTIAVVEKVLTNNSVTVKGLKKGKVIIKALYSKASKTAILNVINRDVTLSEVVAIEIEGEGKDLLINENKQLTANALNINNSIIEAEKIVWSSSNTTVATVNEFGVVTGISSGSAIITASLNGITSKGFEVVLPKSGKFGSITSYKANGTVELIEENGVLSLNFKNDFSISKDIDFKVYLSNTARSISNSVNLGSLKKLSGEQKYIIPSNVKINDYAYVVIWCQAYNEFIDCAKL
ncbi:MAG: DM13 domain-containing protein [Pseudarcicella sp.]|nr:DM13 domain-containing protein [Pseudarcicella sp.]